MSINLQNAVSMYHDIHAHAGHEIEIVSYANGMNVAVECVTCGCVLLDADNPEEN